MPPFFTYTEQPDNSHGRLDQRTVKVYPITALEANLPQARSLVVIERTRSFNPAETPKTAFYITSHLPKQGCAARFAQLARGHWAGCESRNHWVRDACMQEDKTRCKNYNINAVLAGLRVCLINIKALCFPDEPWPSLEQRCQRNPTIAYNAITKMTLS